MSVQTPVPPRKKRNKGKRAGKKGRKEIEFT
jgi:hypothetical protein